MTTLEAFENLHNKVVDLANVIAKELRIESILKILGEICDKCNRRN
jgi:RNase P subunit RPR2